MTPEATKRRNDLLAEIQELADKATDLALRIQSADRLRNVPGCLPVDRGAAVIGQHHLSIGFQMLGRSLFV